MVKGVKTATLKFEVGGDFNKGDCRKCPLSYIAKENNENVYECPLIMRANCKLDISYQDLKQERTRAARFGVPRIAFLERRKNVTDALVDNGSWSRIFPVVFLSGICRG